MKLVIDCSQRRRHSLAYLVLSYTKMDRHKSENQAKDMMIHCSAKFLQQNQLCA